MPALLLEAESNCGLRVNSTTVGVLLESGLSRSAGVATGGHPGYVGIPYETPEEIIEWLENYFPEAKQSAPDLDFANDPYPPDSPREVVVDARDDKLVREELLQSQRIRALFERATRLEKRAATARAERKKRQIERDRAEIKAMVEQEVTRVRTRRRRNRRAIDAILKII